MSEQGREARYAEAIKSGHLWVSRITEAVMAVADAEQAALVAEVERLWAKVAAFEDALRAAGIEHPLTPQGVEDLAAMAEGRLEDLLVAEDTVRAVEALLPDADYEDFVLVRPADLRAALASVGRTEPEDQPAG